MVFSSEVKFCAQFLLTSVILCLPIVSTTHCIMVSRNFSPGPSPTLPAEPNQSQGPMKFFISFPAVHTGRAIASCLISCPQATSSLSSCKPEPEGCFVNHKWDCVVHYVNTSHHQPQDERIEKVSVHSYLSTFFPYLLLQSSFFVSTNFQILP